MTYEPQTSVTALRKIRPLVLRNSKSSFPTTPNPKFSDFRNETSHTPFPHYFFSFLNLDKNIKITDD